MKNLRIRKVQTQINNFPVEIEVHRNKYCGFDGKVSFSTSYFIGYTGDCTAQLRRSKKGVLTVLNSMKNWAPHALFNY